MIHGTLYKTRFTEIGFTLNSPGDWRFVDLSDAQDGNKDHMHCIGASYATKAELLARIVWTHFRIATLEAQGRDRLDFHNLHVNQIKAALKDAWETGKLST